MCEYPANRKPCMQTQIHFYSMRIHSIVLRKVMTVGFGNAERGLPFHIIGLPPWPPLHRDRSCGARHVCWLGCYTATDRVLASHRHVLRLSSQARIQITAGKSTSSEELKQQSIKQRRNNSESRKLTEYGLKNSSVLWRASKQMRSTIYPTLLHTLHTLLHIL